MNERPKTPLTTPCPSCKTASLVAIPGCQLDVTNGVTVYCANKGCSMADWGHGKKEDEALKVFLQKCGAK
jgi:hypothetical protein